MNKAKRYSAEVRERAVRMVFEHEDGHGSQWAAIVSIAEKIGCSGETLRNWVRQAERDTYGVELICDVLPIAPSTYHAHKAREGFGSSVRFGGTTVRLPGFAQRPLSLVVVDGLGTRPLMLLTSMPAGVITGLVHEHPARFRVQRRSAAGG